VTEEIEEKVKKLREEMPDLNKVRVEKTTMRA